MDGGSSPPRRTEDSRGPTAERLDMTGCTRGRGHAFTLRERTQGAESRRARTSSSVTTWRRTRNWLVENRICECRSEGGRGHWLMLYCVSGYTWPRKASSCPINILPEENQPSKSYTHPEIRRRTFWTTRETPMKSHVRPPGCPHPIPPIRFWIRSTVAYPPPYSASPTPNAPSSPH